MRSRHSLQLSGHLHPWVGAFCGALTVSGLEYLVWQSVPPGHEELPVVLMALQLWGPAPAVVGSAGWLSFPNGLWFALSPRDQNELPGSTQHSCSRQRQSLARSWQPLAVLGQWACSSLGLWSGC